MFFRRSLATAAGGGKGRTTVQLFYDIISPYTYIQFELLTRQKAQWPSMELRFTPVAIAPLMTGAGNAPPMMVPAKAVYMVRDLRRLTKFHKIPFAMRPDFPQFAMEFGSIRSQRFLLAAQELLKSEQSEAGREQEEALIRRFFQAFFSPTEPSADISNLEAIQSLALSTGADAGLVAQAAKDCSGDPVKAKLRANTDAASALGGFGLPITAVHLPEKAGGPQAIWGCDRMHIVGHLLGESKPPVLQ
ncbi:Glutathione S-transferase kappa 1 [Tyrophagus putrescentiae]|nr:Glutathione S-transferase kappa 1 [Tyrophagus putrescentiae]